MRILLVNPCAGPEQSYGALAKAATELPQLGLANLGAALEQAGHEVRIVDKAFMEFTDDKILELIGELEFKIVGLSVYITTRMSAIRLAEKIKAKYSNAIVVVGGPDVTLDPQTYLLPYIDYRFIGEADDSILEFVSALDTGNGKLRTEIHGVLANDPSTNSSEQRPRIVSDLNRLPLVKLDHFYDLINTLPPLHIRGQRLINVVFMRGCPYRCTFCAAAAVSGRKLRLIDSDRMIEQIEYYLNAGFDSVSIYDDTFTVNRSLVKEFCQKIVERKLSFSWNCFTRVDCVDDETLETMRKAGCYLITFGIESFNDKTLAKIGKGFTSAEALEGIARVKRAGIAVQSSFMIGLPGETKDDIVSTIKQATASSLNFALFPVFEPYKGTPIYEDCLVEGKWMHVKHDGNRLLVDQDKIWVPNSCRRSDIVALSRLAMRKFYLKPHRVMFLCRWFKSLPVSRWLRLLNFGVSYLVYARFSRTESGTTGSRFR